MSRAAAVIACILTLAVGLNGWSAQPEFSLPGAPPEGPGDQELIDQGVPYLKSDSLIGPFLDLDEYRLEEAAGNQLPPLEPWYWQILPPGLIYAPYLADPKASRFSSNFVHIGTDGWLWDTSLGSQIGLLRYGSIQNIFPEGIQIDVEGSAQARLDLETNIDVRSVDFRGGLPITLGAGAVRWKFGYYHLSSHLGDEFLLQHPTYNRLNFVRDVLILGYSRYWTPHLRTYAEIGWAFNTDVSQPLEFQFGLDYAPRGPTGIRGAPSFAINGKLREEVDFGGAITCQLGWAWRSDLSTSLLRMGAQYYNGKSNQYSFFNEHEEQFGLAIWYDY